VTSDNTGTSGLCFTKPDWNFPPSEPWNAAQDDAGLVGSVDTVACFTRAPLVGLVNMDEMNVVITITEPGRLRRTTIGKCSFFMALKAQSIIVLIV